MIICELLFFLFSMSVADDATTFPTWNITVNDTAPIWAYVSIHLFLYSYRILTRYHLLVSSKDSRQPLWLRYGLVCVYNPSSLLRFLTITHTSQCH